MDKWQLPYVIIALITFVLILTWIVGCTNVKTNQFTQGVALKDATPTEVIEVVQSEITEDVVKYTPLPDWQGYDINPSSSSYKKIYGISKFKDQKIVIAFQQVP